MSALWSDARDTLDPASSTGSSTATGVSAPVRPTCTTMSRSLVFARSAANLKASAHFGNFEVMPSMSWCRSESTFTTAPSVSKG